VFAVSTPATTIDEAGVLGEAQSVPQASTDGLLAHVLSASRAISQATALTHSVSWSSK
jgi:hypothetical protein